MSARNTTDGVEGSWSAATVSDGVPAAARGGLDATSRSIIEQLQQDGRRSYAAIGKAVGLSEAAVRQRVQRLTDSGVMQIVAVTDPMQVGFTRAAMIGIGDSFTIVLRASTSSSRGTAQRTMSAPASATRLICAMVSARFAVSVFVIV